MSKKELLSESQIRRFMTLANLEPLVKNVVSEKAAINEAMTPSLPLGNDLPKNMKEAEDDSKESSDATSMEEPADMPDMEEPEDESPETDMSGDSSAVESKIEEIANQLAELADMVGVEMKVSAGGGEEATADGEEEMKEELEEDLEEAKKKPAKKAKDDKKEEEEEMDESVELSEDSLVETVLARVTARLVQEAKKSSKKMSPKEKAEMKKKEMEAKKKKLKEATSAEGGGPLLKQGKNKYDVYKGHADMAYAKGKEGKGGHQMETMTAKAEHTVTHGGKNLATLGGNKKKV